MISLPASLATGFGLGFLVGAQVGPIWLLCARTSLRHGAPSGLAVGAGAAVVDTAYACLGVAGAARLLQVPGLRLGLGLLGAAVLVLLGGRTLWSALRVRLGAEVVAEVASPLRALRTSLTATASNPMTIASWAAIFAAASAAGVARTGPDAVLMLAGVGAGSLAWFTVLSAGMALLRRRIGQRGLRLADGLAGLGLLGFGGLLGWQALHPRA
ncbi:MAG TPA: LysE family transporter [Candidatus Dormibacteraeota bacterium]|nr:LysE family transporter [Candidatus Dormibacteraeota bacterium]